MTSIYVLIRAMELWGEGRSLSKYTKIPKGTKVFLEQYGDTVKLSVIDGQYVGWWITVLRSSLSYWTRPYSALEQLAETAE